MNDWFLQFLMGGTIEAMRHPQDWNKYMALSRFLQAAVAHSKETLVHLFQTKH